MTTAHIVPSGDLVEHNTDADGADCICGPDVAHVPNTAGPDGWLIIHHSLDGREQPTEGHPQ